jgi:hypothetical protein
MRLDLPTFDLPIKAYSYLLSVGHLLTVGEETTNSDFFISMFVVLKNEYCILKEKR